MATEREVDNQPGQNSQNRVCYCNRTGCNCLLEVNYLFDRLKSRELPRIPHKTIFQVVSIDFGTSDAQISKMLLIGARILHIQLAHGTKDELEQLMLRVTTTIANYCMKQKFPTPIALAIEIRGRVVRLGRFRNKKPIQLKEQKRVILTSNNEYENCGTCHVMYLSNFFDYISELKSGDYIFINQAKVHLVIVKVVLFNRTVTCYVLKGGLVKSYMRVTLPYYMASEKNYTNDELSDCEFAIRHNVDFIVLPSVVDAESSHGIRQILDKAPKVPSVLANIDRYAMDNEIYVDKIIKSFDGFWIDKYSKSTISEWKNVMEKAQKLSKPVVCSIKEKLFREKNRCKIIKLRRFEEVFYANINPSSEPYQEKVAELQHLLLTDAKNAETDCHALSTLLAVTKLIIAITNIGWLAIYLSNKNPTCLVLAITKHPDLAARLTLWQNVLPLVCSFSNISSEAETEHILNYALNYAKSNGYVRVGDFIGYCYHSQSAKDQNSFSFRTIFVSKNYIKIE